jgi:hypothetical protein
MKTAVLAVLVCAGMISMPATQVSGVAQVVVTAAQVNGTWRSKHGEFKVLALGRQKLRIEFAGAYEYNSPSGPTAHTGEARGVATIEENVAVFKPEHASDDCKIILRFSQGKLIVTEEGSCGFGMNVTSAGTYRKVSAAKPKFLEN